MDNVESLGVWWCVAALDGVYCIFGERIGDLD